MSCFKAYDIRGHVPDELDETLARRIGNAFAAEFGLKNIVIGRDVRLSGKALSEALADGARLAGCAVTDIGVCGTEEMYHAVFSQGFDGGVIVTASHNPAGDNGMKFVLAGAKPVSGDTGLFAIRDRALGNAPLVEAPRRGNLRRADFRKAYIDHLLGHVKEEPLAPLTIVADAGNGCAGPVVRELARHLPFRFIFLNDTPDGTFPCGVPNPLLPERRIAAAEAVRANRADLGIAWDGDFDRCFLFDADGNFIEGYYMVGLLAQTLLKDHPGEAIIHDPRLVWNTRDIVEAHGGVPLENKTGHAFMKERMRAENALYGGEMSAHHYFRDFAYCDSGMIPWLLVASLMSRTGKPLGELVAERIRAFPCSGEINRRVASPEAAVAAVRARFSSLKPAESFRDGLSMAFPDWRFNLRSSNTEPLLRLNVETRANPALLREKTAEILAILDRFSEGGEKASASGNA